MNQNGFTMVEILVTVTILGLLLAMTYAGYTEYQDWARSEAYSIMAHSAKQAAEDYLMDHPGIAGGAAEQHVGSLTYYLPSEDHSYAITFKELEEQGYFSTPVDPGLKSHECIGSVNVGVINGTGPALDQYIYDVKVCCYNYTKEHVFTLKKSGSTYESYEPIYDLSSCPFT